MKRLSDIVLVDNYKHLNKGENFFVGQKLYKILGFDSTNLEEVFAVRILLSTFKPSRKQPIFEIFNFNDIKK